MIWPLLWIAAMLALVLATAVVAFREKGTRTKAAKALTPQPLDIDGGADDLEMGFGEVDAVDAFGIDEAQAGEFASLEDDTFK